MFGDVRPYVSLVFQLALSDTALAGRGNGATSLLLGGGNSAVVLCGSHQHQGERLVTPQQGWYCQLPTWYPLTPQWRCSRCLWATVKVLSPVGHHRYHPTRRGKGALLPSRLLPTWSSTDSRVVEGSANSLRGLLLTSPC